MKRLLDLGRRAPWLAPLLVLVGALAVVYAPLFFGEITFHRDIGRLMWPRRFWQHAALSEGRLPLWNWGLGLGRSSFAEPQVGLFYPPSLLFAFGATPWMLSFFSFLHLAWGGAGMARLARRLGAGAAAGAVAALAWSLGGVATSEWTSGYRMLAASWLPWCALALVFAADEAAAGADGARRAISRGAAAVAVPVAMALCLGEVFVVLIAVGFGLVLAVARLGTGLPRDARGAAFGRATLATAVGGACGVACGAVAWLPAIALAPGTERAAPLAREIAEMWSVHPMRLVEFLAPGTFATLYEHTPGSPLVARLLDGAPLMLSIYLGGAVLALAVLAPRRRRGERGQVLALVILAALGLALALGRHTPLHALLRAVVPPLAYMRYPEKYLVILVAAVALLAAAGCQRLLEPDEDAHPARMAARIGVLAGLPLGAAAFGGLLPAEIAAPVRRGAVHASVAVLVVLALVAARVRWRLQPRVLGWLLLVVVAADLGVAALPIRRFGDAAQLTAKPPAAAMLLADHARARLAYPPRLYRSPALTEAVARAGTLPPELRSLATLRDNFSIPLGIGIFPGYDAATPTILLDLARQASPDVLRLFAVGYALLPASGSVAEAAVGAGLEPLGDPVAGATLYRVAGALPRAYVAASSTVGNEADLRRLLLARDVVTGERVLLDAGQDGAGAREGAAGGAGRCEVRRFEETRIVATCEASAEAWAVFVEQDEPGWSATLDGVAAPLLRANLVERAVPLPAGRHEVVLAYQPPHLKRAGALSLVGLLALAALAVGGWHRRMGAHVQVGHRLPPRAT